MYLTVVAIPLFSAIGAGFGGRFFGKGGTIWFTLVAMFASLLNAIYVFYEVGLRKGVCSVSIGTWIESGVFNVNWGFLFDQLTATMLVVVTFVSFLVHLYSTGYMSADPHFSRFMAYLSLFTFFMLMLITAENYLQMFVGWEGVGLCSYLLINFWFTRYEANRSALKAILVNRVGDFFLGLGLIVVFLYFRSLDFAIIFSSAYYAQFFESFSNVPLLGVDFGIITLIVFLLFMGAVGKSAQLGLHTWLPDAMEGPTPVSALIHAATMVTAGVFVLLRSSALLELTPTVLALIVLVGGFTALFGSSVGLFQYDLKKVIAYSTTSQLGYMVFACGLSLYTVSFFHLVNHAFFKALLFLSAGAVIHAVADEQDMRKMGGLCSLLPISYLMMFVGSLSLMGFPFLTGFYSKDLILESAVGLYGSNAGYVYWLAIVAAWFTAAYSFRLLYLAFGNDVKLFKMNVTTIHEAPKEMLIPLVALFFGTVFAGYIGKDLFVGLGSDFWGVALSNHPANVLIEFEMLSVFWKWWPIISSVCIGFLLFLASLSLNVLPWALNGATRIKLVAFFVKKWGFDLFYNNVLVDRTMNLAYQIMFKAGDRGIIELVGPRGAILGSQFLGRCVSNLQTGYIYHYAGAMALGCLLMVLAFSFPVVVPVVFLAEGDFFSVIAIVPFLVLIWAISLMVRVSRLHREGGGSIPPLPTPLVSGFSFVLFHNKEKGRVFSNIGVCSMGFAMLAKLRNKGQGQLNNINFNCNIDCKVDMKYSKFCRGMSSYSDKFFGIPDAKLPRCGEAEHIARMLRERLTYKHVAKVENEEQALFLFMQVMDITHRIRYNAVVGGTNCISAFSGLMNREGVSMEPQDRHFSDKEPHSTTCHSVWNIRGEAAVNLARNGASSAVLTIVSEVGSADITYFCSHLSEENRVYTEGVFETYRHLNQVNN